jgi:GNAT superfamily N-acetyltransferase
VTELEHLTIRQATLADAEQLARLRWDFAFESDRPSDQPFEEFARAFAEFLAESLGEQWTIWVAERQGRLVANMTIQVVRKLPRPGHIHRFWGYVTNVYTLPEERSRGVGGQLLAALIGWARERELEFLILWPREESVPFYERHGFVHSPDAMELHLG